MKTKAKTKTSIFLTLAFKAFVFSVLFTSALSCKDDQEEKPANQFTVDGSAKAVKTAFFIYDQSPGTSPVDGQPYYRHELVLLTDGFTFNGDQVSGSGSALDLLINGKTEALDAGTFNFTGTENNPKALDFWEGSTYIDFTVGTTSGQELEFTAGKIIVSKSGDIYTIDVDGTAGGKAIKGHYTGLLTSAADD